VKWATFLMLLVAGVAGAETRVGVGAGLLSDQFSGGFTLTITERINKKWEVGLFYVDEQDVCPAFEVKRGKPCPVFVDRNWAFFGKRIWTFRGDVNPDYPNGAFRMHFGLGVAKWAETNRALGSEWTIPVSIGIDLPPFWGQENVSLYIHHFSNAGSHTPNMGQDAIELTWTFGGTNR